MSGYFCYVSKSDFDPSVFIGHVMYQRVNASCITQRSTFSSRSYNEALEVSQLICDYLNHVS